MMTQLSTEMFIALLLNNIPNNQCNKIVLLLGLLFTWAYEEHEYKSMYSVDNQKINPASETLILMSFAVKKR